MAARWTAPWITLWIQRATCGKKAGWGRNSLILSFLIFLNFPLDFHFYFAIIVFAVIERKAMERWLSWSKAHDWKSCNVLKAFKGSNPFLSAIRKTQRKLCFSFFILQWDSKAASWQCAGGTLQPAWLFRRKANPFLSAIRKAQRKLCFFFFCFAKQGKTSLLFFVKYPTFCQVA